MRKEVAKLAGVSEATVSRVLNGVGPVREETKRRVLEAAEQLKYVPSQLAQRFARKRSGNLGVIIPSLPKVHLFSTYYFSEILSGIGEAAKEEGYDLLLMFRRPDEPRDYDLLFRTHKVDACIMLGLQDLPEERQALAKLAAESHPFCLINQRFDGEPFRSVDADHVAGSCLAVGHLIDNGCRRIALVNGPLTYSNSIDRELGYRQALEEAGLSYASTLVYQGNFGRKSGYELADALAGQISQGAIDGIFAANDRMAIGLLQGLREHELIAGRHYALIGYDDSDGSRLTQPQLSSVAVPFFEMGRRAARVLLAKESKGETGGELPLQLVVRESSGLQQQHPII
ncbi:LacI family transcriptional regulator [Paenibacillus sp. 598K]|uniref:LacI family DNA-binding transcriptional regulator n=1 Tax=Paenibacillus sp. 598K TaxID=1117987 RepID=UPI000FF94EC3|nr:LacI family DNA-binding transcriptional regulator [Paenibacillus sp. 598K]GBF74993.1 LacI family transcriptional regulator [Paenibacillus sp. 598K]